MQTIAVSRVRCTLRQSVGPEGRVRLQPRVARPLVLPSRRRVTARASKDDEEKRIQEIEASLKKSGLDRERAQEVLKLWRDSAGEGKEITAEDLRKVLVKQGSRISLLVVVQILLDAGAAYGAFLAGTFLYESAAEYGTISIVLSAIASLLSGYYAMGALSDVFKLGMLLTATYQFNVNSAAFLAAVQDLAGAGPTGLATVDKAVEAVNTVKVIAGLNKMAALLKDQAPASVASSNDMMKDLAAYLTLEKAQRLYGFTAADYGISDREAAEIATVFSAFDADDNGLLSLDEFQKLCASYAPDLNAAEVKASMQLLDTNKDGSIQLGEFVDWWQQQSKKA